MVSMGHRSWLGPVAGIAALTLLAGSCFAAVASGDAAGTGKLTLSIGDLFRQGGWTMYMLLLASVMAVEKNCHGSIAAILTVRRWRFIEAYSAHVCVCVLCIMCMCVCVLCIIYVCVCVSLFTDCVCVCVYVVCMAYSTSFALIHGMKTR